MPDPGPLKEVDEDSEETTQEWVDEGAISREVLFSRALAGIVDLVLATATGLLFALTAGLVLQIDFFSGESLQIAGIFALFFFYLNSLFFLLTSGRTPGMLLTDLRVISEDAEDGDDLSSGAVLVRVALFLPTVATLLGLVYALFDPFHRCLHDRLSGTRVVPVDRL